MSKDLFYFDYEKAITLYKQYRNFSEVGRQLNRSSQTVSRKLKERYPDMILYTNGRNLSRKSEDYRKGYDAGYKARLRELNNNEDTTTNRV